MKHIVKIIATLIAALICLSSFAALADTAITTADSQLEDQMADYYSSELAQMDYYNY